MASLFDPGGSTETPYGRVRTNAGYGALQNSYTNPAGGLETRTNGDTTFGNASNPFSAAQTATTGTLYPTGPGNQIVQPGTAAPTPTATAAPNYGWLDGYNLDKLSNPANQNAKSQIGRTLGQFNPAQGYTDPVLQALNALGLAQFSGSGDRLSLSNVTSKGTAAGLDPHNFNGDFIENWTGADPNDHSGAKWTYDAYTDPATTAATDPMASTASLLSSLFAQPTQSAMPDMSWIGPLIASLTQQPQAPAPAPAPAPASTAPLMPAQSQPTPVFNGGYVTPGYGPVGSAASTMSQSLSQLITDPRYANDPLAQRILAMIGGHQ